jgi:DNA 3'-phosphatase
MIANYSFRIPPLFRQPRGRSLRPMLKTGSGGILLCLVSFGNSILKMGRMHLIPSTCYDTDNETSFRLVVISNQGGIALRADTSSKAPKANHTTKLASFKTKVSTVFNQLDIPISIYAATAKDIYRKPRTGMWKEILEDYDIHSPGSIDLENSVFVGDAGGRIARSGKPKDFSCSDRYIFRILPCFEIANKE